jgi:hypothetical protein
MSDTPPPTPSRSDPPPAASDAPAIEFGDYRAGDEGLLVGVLNACQPGEWGDEASWAWKYRDRPGFIADDVVAARSGGKVVGCFHGAVLPLKLEEGLVVPMSFDGDYAVLPEHRGRDIPLAAHDLIDERLRARHVVFRGGFTSRELKERFYHRYFGYVFAPVVTTQYRKYLGPGPLAPRVAALGERLLDRPPVRRALERGLVIDLEIPGFAASNLELSAAGFRLAHGAAAAADLRARIPYWLLTSFASGGERPRPGAILRALCGGRIRAHGLFRSAPRLIALGLALLRRSS